MNVCAHTPDITCTNCAPKVCRTCGSCPTCGRGGYAQPYPSWPYGPTTAPWPYTTWGGDSTNTTNTTDTGKYRLIQ